MMRYQRVSPDLLPLSNGRKPINHVRTCSEDPSSIRVRPVFGSGSSNPAQIQQEASTSSHFPPASDPLPSESSNGRDVLLQWGHRKRSRGSRAEHRTAVEESTSSPARSTVKIQRRAAIAGAEKIAAAAAAAAAASMPPPLTRGANLRPCGPPKSCSPTNHNHFRTVEDGSSGQSRFDKKRSPPPHEKKPASVIRNGFGPDPQSTNRHPDQKLAPDHDKEKARAEHLEWPRIYVSLSRKEKEEDFLAMKGTKLPQRPKKRPKNVDKALQYCFPGTWLPDVTKGRYEVREKKCVKKKPRGLKGMERSMDSDSE